MRTRSIPLSALASGGAVLALLLSGCSGGDGPAATSTSTSASASESTSASPSETPTPTPTDGLAADASPLSGRPGGAGKQVLVVKYDNTHNAQPHAGLTSADVVYVEEVEYGLTRIAAVFSTSLPPVVGPVRSARISDLDLFAQYGSPAFAYSGAQAKMRPLIARSGFYDVSGDKSGVGYYRAKGRPAPYDFMGRPAVLLKRAPKASTASDIGFSFAVATPPGGTPKTSVLASYPDSQAQFVWNAKRGSYDVLLNKRPARAEEGGTQHATTVVIQYVQQHDSGFGDKFGGVTPKEETIGTGTGWVLRDGQAWKVRWSRPSKDSGTQFIGADGQVVAFAPGQVWVALVNAKTPAVLR